MIYFCFPQTKINDLSGSLDARLSESIESQKNDLIAVRSILEKNNKEARDAAAEQRAALAADVQSVRQAHATMKGEFDSLRGVLEEKNEALDRNTNEIQV